MAIVCVLINLLLIMTENAVNLHFSHSTHSSLILLEGEFSLLSGPNLNPVYMYNESVMVMKQDTGLQIYGGPGSLFHDFQIWPITFQGSGPSGPILFSCEKFSL